MRYFAICLLSLITFIAPTNALSVTMSHALIEAAVPVVANAAADAGDLRRDALGVLVGAALVVLQLRRRQKSFGMPRAFG